MSSSQVSASSDGMPPTYGPSTTAPQAIPSTDLTENQQLHLEFFLRLCKHLRNPATMLHMQMAAERQSWDRTAAVSTPRRRLFRSNTQDVRTTEGYTRSRAQANTDIGSLIECINSVRTVSNLDRLSRAYPALVVLHDFARDTIGMPTHPDITRERYTVFGGRRMELVPGSPLAFEWLAERYQETLNNPS